MSKKKKKTKKNLANGVTEEEFLTVLDNISKRLGNKFKFGYHTFEDMKQQAAIFALEGLERYDNKRPLENFLWTHVRNRLFNYKRDNYQRPDKPCLTCPFYDKHFQKSDSQCTEYKDISECSLYSSWLERNSAKKNIMKPVGIDSLSFNFANKTDVDQEVSNEQIFEIIESNLPTQYRELYLRYRYGDKINKNDQNKIVNIIRKILEENKDG
jgi:DNA-directed RNA polymerase specialized sigma24 family protein